MSRSSGGTRNQRGVAALPCADTDTAEAANRQGNPWIHELNGPWKFHWSPEPAKRPVEFYRADFDDANWTTLPVPSNWQLHGHGVPLYVNISGIPSRRPAARDGRTAARFHELHAAQSGRFLPPAFSVPDDWKGRQVFLQFDGVDSAFYLWINGQKVGYSQDSRTPAIFNVTKYLQSGDNVAGRRSLSLLRRQLPGRSGLLAVERYLPRRLSLDSRGSAHSRFLRPDRPGSTAYRDATLRVEVEIVNFADASQTCAVAGHFAGTRQRSSHRFTQAGAAGGPQTTPLDCKTPEWQLENPAKWTAETPNLYRLLLTSRTNLARRSK